jgi:hypothetical protein
MASFEAGGTDSVTGSVARGRVGPRSGDDDIEFTGEIREFSLNGPATVILDGVRVSADELGGSRTQRHTLTVTKAGSETGVATYTLRVSGRTYTTSDFEDGGTDRLMQSAARGRVGPESGLDRVQFTGEVLEFRLNGPAVVLLDGVPVPDGNVVGVLGQSPPCLLNAFEKYSTESSAYYERTRTDMAETAERAASVAQLSGLNTAGIGGLVAVAKVGYGDVSGGAEEFLNKLSSTTEAAAVESDVEFVRTLNRYAQSAKTAHDLVFGNESTLDEYVRLVSDASKLQERADEDTIAAALVLTYKAASGSLKSDVQSIVIDFASRPLDDAALGLQYNIRQMLILKTYAESQRPIIHTLERLTKARENGQIAERGMLAYFVLLQEFAAATWLFSNQMANLERIAKGRSVVFDLARILGESADVHGDLEAQFSAHRSLAQSNYEDAIERLALFDRDARECR